MALHVAETPSLSLPPPTGLLLPTRDGEARAGGDRLFFDVDRGAMAFQRRVFEEVTDRRNPLLERVRFLAILGTNLIPLAAQKPLAGAAKHLWCEAHAYWEYRLCPVLAQRGLEPPAIDPTLTTGGLLPLWMLSELDRPDLRDAPIRPRDPIAAGPGGIFDAIRTRDVLLHHPYDSFVPVVDLIQQAAVDPAVTAIAITLYRTDRDSPIGRALIDARRHGKHVQAVIELRARRDEENNARWAAALRQAGAEVSYGIVGLKVHAKLAVITRREGAVTRRYAHISSGNYHSGTSLAYADVALLTCDAAIADEASELFAFLAGRRGAPAFRRLLVAPFDLRHRVRDLIAREIECSRGGKGGHIILKMNTLTDRDLIRQLYRASEAGVRVDLIVRGVCCLRPGVPGLSERIHVRSIVGRFLEHSRIWYFRNGGRSEVYIGSADLRLRNLDGRVEVMVPIDEPSLAREIRHGILETCLADNVSARALRADGCYVRLHPGQGELAVSSQHLLLEPPLAEGVA